MWFCIVTTFMKTGACSVRSVRSTCPKVDASEMYASCPIRVGACIVRS
jgi:hypothetical protein